jgi:hypothetical protein
MATAPASGPAAESSMKDEYGNMDSSGETFVAKNFVLESGQVLKEAHVRWLPPSGPWFTVSPPSGF